MIKIVTIIGARPQIIKAAALSRAIRNNFKESIEEILVHTGQHYDQNMSEVFFEELNIPAPNYNLQVGSSSHASQTAAMLTGIENILLKERPQALLVYGDTNSTLAGALTASKMRIPVIHVEAGLRSFNKNMPEEINRIACDHVSTLLFSPSSKGVENLRKEGFTFNTAKEISFDNPLVFHCGDVMYDNSLHFSSLADTRSTILSTLNLEPGKFILATIHRDNNTDRPERLNALFSAFQHISSEFNIKVVLPLHPRTDKLLEHNLEKELFRKIKSNPNIILTDPASFLDMIALEKNCKMVMTDSGGVQKEAFFFKKPCVILRSETEWVELVENGNALLSDANESLILEAFKHFNNSSALQFPPLYGDGNAGDFICTKILEVFKS